MNTLELFSGTKSFSKVAKELGHNTFTVDIDKNLEPDLVADIMSLGVYRLPLRIDVLWMSPPCTTFSVASLRHYWTKGKPKNDKCLHGIAMVKKALEIKDELLKVNPNMLWYMENPRGMLRKQEFMQKLPRRVTISYCQYGHEVMKPTDIWTNDFAWIPKKMCSPGSNCHNSAKRGSDTGTQGKGGGGKYGWLKRTSIPSQLFYEIFKQMEANK